MDLVVSADSRTSTRGHLRYGDTVVPCALGRGGLTLEKREGDGATPVAEMPIRAVRFRSDRIAAAPRTKLPILATTVTDGWCDDPGSPDYNRPIRLPHSAGHELMFREDPLYDVVVILGWNDAPPVPGGGSAIFLHVARPDLSPTEGCVAVPRDMLLPILACLEPGDTMVVTNPER